MEQEIEFESLAGKLALTVFHFNDGELKEDMPVFVERNRRTRLQPAVLKAWQIGEVKNDITGYGKYANSSVTVEIDGIPQIWPFSMVYLQAEELITN